MKTSGLKKKSTIPVSQNQLAAYLSIQPSALSMANSAKYKRKLPLGAAQKLAGLQLDFELMEYQPKKPGISSVQIKILADKAAMKEYTNLLSEAKYFEAGAGQLAKRLDEMCSLFKQDLRWLHVIDARLAASPTKNERKWLDYQQVITAERIEKNGIMAQFKLQLNIELARAKATVYKKMAKEIADRL